MPRFTSIVFGALLTLSVSACGDDEGGGGANNQMVCEDACDKVEECAPGLIDVTECKAQCSEPSGGTGGSDCTPAEEQAAIDHIKGCLNMECAEYLQCASEAPTCG